MGVVALRETPTWSVVFLLFDIWHLILNNVVTLGCNGNMLVVVCGCSETLIWSQVAMVLIGLEGNPTPCNPLQWKDDTVDYNIQQLKIGDICAR